MKYDINCALSIFFTRSICAMIIAIVAQSGAISAPEGWTKAIELDFSRGDTLSNSDWGLETGFVRNKELAYYIGTIGPTIRVQNGNLVIEAKRYDGKNLDSNLPSELKGPDGYPVQYISGSIFTKRAWKCGRFEVTSRLPAADGLFPAIWLGGTAKNAYGEIDIVELLGRNPNVLNTTFHYGKNAGSLAHIARKMPCSDCSKKFRTYTAEVQKNKFSVFVDGQMALEHTAATELENIAISQPFRLRINLAAGGPYPGPIGTRALPSEMLISKISISTKNCD